MALSNPTASVMPRRKSGRKPLELLSRAVFYVVLAIIFVYTIFPFYWAIVGSLTPTSARYDIQYIPTNITFEHYVNVFTKQAFHINLINSLIIAGMTVTLSLLIGSLSAYALGRYRFRGKSFVLYLILSVSIFPNIAVLPGLFTLINSLGLYNTHAGLVFSYLIGTLPFTVWVLTSFVREIPGELEEAAIVDGATPLQTLRFVMLPVMAPGLVTTGLLAFIGAWNEYLFALTFTIDNTARTVPVAIGLFRANSAQEVPWGPIMAGSIVVTVPLIILVLIFQNRIISGLTAGAVKG
jgi:trehalose/maltose transport system permease protein